MAANPTPAAIPPSSTPSPPQPVASSGPPPSVSSPSEIVTPVPSPLVPSAKSPPPVSPPPDPTPPETAVPPPVPALVPPPVVTPPTPSPPTPALPPPTQTLPPANPTLPPPTPALPPSTPTLTPPVPLVPPPTPALTPPTLPPPTRDLSPPAPIESPPVPVVSSPPPMTPSPPSLTPSPPSQTPPSKPSTPTPSPPDDTPSPIKLSPPPSSNAPVMQTPPSPTEDSPPESSPEPPSAPQSHRHGGRHAVSPPQQPTNSDSSLPPSSPDQPVISTSPPSPKPELPSELTPGNVTDATRNISAPEQGSDGNGGIKAGTIVGIGFPIFVVVLVVTVIIWYMRRKKKKNVGGYAGGYVIPSPLSSSQQSDRSHPSAPLVKVSSRSHDFPYSPPDPGLGNSKAWFTYEELSRITKGFSSQNLLGEGGFGRVYKGCQADGREVAVKQLKVGGGQGEREFQAEVEIISRVHHRHLVSLVGYCVSANQRLLVYDFVPNDTLHYHLHGEGRPVMDWETRVKVAAGAARGLAYLHEDCHPRIIHRDIKSSNILLDYSFEAQVSDFGLAKLTVDAQTHVTTRVMGTFGYMAPEYASSGKLTDRSDVFSFGVVLLELITGRKPVDSSQPVGDESLVEWARPLMTLALETRNFEDLPDPRLNGNFKEDEMIRMIETAAACVRHSAPMRPRMGLVMRALNNLAENLDLHNGVRPGQSELYNSGANSSEIRLFQRMAFGGPDGGGTFSYPSWSRSSQTREL